MNIDEAIKILSGSIIDSPTLMTLKQDAAIKLGIEALKRLKEYRHSHIDIFYRALSGETDES